jgi:hypothetical protein
MSHFVILIILNFFLDVCCEEVNRLQALAMLENIGFVRQCKAVETLRVARG